MARFFDDASSEGLGVSSAPVTAPPFSVSAWFYVDSDGQPDAMWSIADVSSGTQFYSLQAGMSTAGDPVRFGATSGAAAYADSGGSISTNTWHHGAGVTASTSSRYAYLDGTVGSESTITKDVTGIDTSAIGRSADLTPFFYFSGAVAEVAVWDVVLTQAEIDMLAAGYSALFVRPGSLKSYSKLIRDEDLDLITGNLWTPDATPTIQEHPRIIYPSAQILSFPAPAAAPSSGPIAGSLGLTGVGI